MAITDRAVPTFVPVNHARTPSPSPRRTRGRPVSTRSVSQMAAGAT